MKVILLKDVKGQGKKDAVLDVSDGYANNYLIKNGLAVLYTKKSKEILENEIELRKDEEDKLVCELTKIKNELVNKKVEFVVKTGKDDRVFGAISSKQISEKLASMGYKIDKKCIKIDVPIQTLGVTNVLVELHKKVKFELSINLIK